MNAPPVVTNTKVEQLKTYIAENRTTCRDCDLPCFWVSTPTGKRILMDFPDEITRPDPTHRLVMGSKDGAWDGTVEAWPHDGASATHTVHWDTCGGQG